MSVEKVGKCIIDYWPDDEDGLSLYVYAPLHVGWRFSLGQSYCKVHVNDIEPGGKYKQGLYRFPFLADTIARVRNYAQLDNCIFTEDFLTYACQVINDSIADEIQIDRIQKLVDAAKVPDDANLFEQLKARELLKRIPQRVTAPSGRVPYTHQKVMRECIISMKQAGLYCEPGTGKTFSTAQGLEWRYLRNHIEHALIIVPVSLVKNWAKEVDEHTMLCALPLTEKTTTGKLRQLEQDWLYNQVIIVNYESLHGIMQWLDMHLDWAKTAVVLDESTKIKNPSAKRSKQTHVLGRKARYKYELTGTPITQGAQDVFSQFKFLDGGSTFGLSFERFKNQYFWRNVYARGPGQYEVRPGALDTISDKIFKKAIRFTKDECLDLPDKIYHRRYCELPDFQKEIYKRIQIDALLNIEEGNLEISAPIILVELLRLAQVTSGHVNGTKHKTEQEIILEMIEKGAGWVDPSVKKTVYFEEQPKIDMLRNMLTDELSSEQVIVWSRFIPERKLIKDMLKAAKIPFSSFDTHDRQEAVDLFQHGKARVFVGNPASGGHGITLTASRDMIFMSNSFSLEQRQQAEDRNHRIGQTRKCNYYDIVVEGSIDEKVLDVLEGKADIARQVVRDGARTFLGATH